MMRWTGGGLVLVIAVLAGCGSNHASTSSPSPSRTAQASGRQSTPPSTEEGETTQAAPAEKSLSSSLEPCDVLTMEEAEQLYPMLASSELRAGESNFDHPQIVCLLGSEPNVSFAFIGGPPAPNNLSAGRAWEREATAFRKAAGLEVKAGETEAKIQEVSGLGERAMLWYFPLPAAGGAGIRAIWKQDGVAAKLEILGPPDQLPSEQQFLEFAEELATKF